MITNVTRQPADVLNLESLDSRDDDDDEGGEERGEEDEGEKEQEEEGRDDEEEEERGESRQSPSSDDVDDFSFSQASPPEKSTSYAHSTAKAASTPVPTTASEFSEEPTQKILGLADLFRKNKQQAGASPRGPPISARGQQARDASHETAESHDGEYVTERPRSAKMNVSLRTQVAGFNKFRLPPSKHGTQFT